jgi:signal transduction histidine kinase
VYRLSGVQARLVFILLLVSVPTFGVFITGYVAYRVQEEKRAAVDLLQQQARAIASSRGVLLDQTEALLRSLASLPQLRNMSREPQACGEVLSETLQGSPQYSNIAAADMAGRVICRGLALQPKQPITVTDRAWFQRVVARREFVVGSYAIGRTSGEPSVHTAYPILDEQGRMIGAVNAGVRLSWLDERFAGVYLPRGILVMLIDSTGTLLLRHPTQPELIGRELPGAARIIVEQGRGTFDLQMLDGVRRIAAFEPLGGIRWDDITIVVAADSAYLWNPIWKTVGLQVIGFTLVLGLALIGAILGAYRLVVRPVRTLEAAVTAYASGDHGMRATEAAPGELGRLARAFNAMAEQLSQQESALREASAQKSRYLAIASHDLRQPLQVMIIKLESGIANSDGKLRANLLIAQRAAERLMGQLDLLAGVVRADLEGSDLQLRIQEVSIGHLLENVARAHRDTAENNGIDFHVMKSSLAVASDPDALLTIINNLVMNAINYTTKGRVMVGCRRRGPMCRLEVHDTGPGIPPESRIKIFKAFQRLDPEASAGLGLGLSIARETAALLKHPLMVHSVVGKGSCFCVEIPLWKG